MSPPLSPRAQEILDAIERDALARRGAPDLGPVPPPSPAVAPPPVAAAPPPAPPEPTDPTRLLELVDALTAQAEQARRRLGTLTDALRDAELQLDPVPADPSANAVPEPAAPPAEPAATAAKPAPAPPVAPGVADLHHHLLPGIDDGPPTVEEAVALARAAVEAGTSTVVVTPHVSWDYPDTDAALIAGAVAELRDALAAADVRLEVLTGGEIAATRAVDLGDDELAALRLGGGPWILVECPLTPAAPAFERLVDALLDRGHRILLAHPERSPTFQRDPELLERLIARGLLAQVTASSLTGAFGSSVREHAHGLVREGLVQVVASDAHSVDKRPPRLREDVEDEGFGELASWLTAEVPGAILAGTPIPPRPELHGRGRGAGLKRLLGR